MARFYPLLFGLHWPIALLMIVAWVFGRLRLAEMPNDGPEKLFALRAHMSSGIIVLILMLLFRLAARFLTVKPPHATTGNAITDRLGVAMPASKAIRPAHPQKSNA
ncbi:MAG: hypothetical protein KJN60_03065 [Boseongicola sp.]|nr:hypothetical protein [Boseongicola sp.]